MRPIFRQMLRDGGLHAKYATRHRLARTNGNALTSPNDCHLSHSKQWLSDWGQAFAERKMYVPLLWYNDGGGRYRWGGAANDGGSAESTRERDILRDILTDDSDLRIS